VREVGVDLFLSRLNDTGMPARCIAPFKYVGGAARVPHRGFTSPCRLSCPDTASEDEADPQADKERRNGIAADEAGEASRH
jgi:hypothetical protein